jgi:hypothetical protein
MDRRYTVEKSPEGRWLVVLYIDKRRSVIGIYPTRSEAQRNRNLMEKNEERIMKIESIEDHIENWEQLVSQSRGQRPFDSRPLPPKAFWNVDGTRVRVEP